MNNTSRIPQQINRNAPSVQPVAGHEAAKSGHTKGIIEQPAKSALVNKIRLRKRKTLGRGWIAVNVSARDELEMRKVAAADGMTFRLFCEFALRSAKLEKRESLGLSWDQFRKLTPGQIKALGERARWLRSMSIGYIVFPERN
jgi:hypothetical protein